MSGPPYVPVNVEFGASTILPIKLERIKDEFLSLVFASIEKDSECNITKITSMPIENLDDVIPDIDGYLTRDDKNKLPKQSGGIRNLLDIYIRFLYKLIGIPIENFLKLLEPFAFLSSGLFANMEFGDANLYGNPLQIPNIAWIALQLSKPSTISLGIKNGIKFAQEIIIKIKNIIIDVLKPLIKIVTDIKGFIIDLLAKPLNYLSLPIPSFPLGFAGIEFPSFDKFELFKGVNALSLEKFGIKLPGLKIPEIQLPTSDLDVNFDINFIDLNIGDLITKPFEVIQKFLGRGDLPVPQELLDKLAEYFANDDNNVLGDLPEIDISEFDWIENITKDPIAQFEYIMKIANYTDPNGKPYLPYFYRENGLDVNGFKWYYSWDFFKNFELDTKEENIEGDIYEIHGLWNSITDAQLDNDNGFRSKVYFLLESFDWANWDKLPEEAQRIMKKKYPVKGSSGNIIKNEPKSFSAWRGAEGLLGNDRITFYNILKKTFEYNFWNTVKYRIDDNGKYIKDDLSWIKSSGGLPLTYRGRYNYKIDKKYHKDTDELGNPTKNQNITIDGYTRYNYKKFKMDFFKLIYNYKDKIQFFTSHQRLDYVLDYNEYMETVDNLTVDFTDILRLSNERETNGETIFGILENNAFRIDVGLKPLSSDSDPLAGFRDPDTGMPNFKASSFAKLNDIIKDMPCIPPIASFIFTSIDLVRNLIMFPLNFMINIVMTILDIVKKVLMLNIPGAIKKIGELVKMLMPSLDFFGDLIMKILSPLMKPFADKTKKRIDDTNDEMLDTARNNPKFNLKNVDIPNLNVNLPQSIPLNIGKLSAAFSSLKLPDVSIPEFNIALDSLNLPSINAPNFQISPVDLAQVLTKLKLPSIKINSIIFELSDITPPTPSFPKFDLGKIQAKLPNVNLPMSKLEGLSKFQISQCSGLMALMDRMELIAMIGLPKLHLNVVMELFCFVLELITSSLPIPIPGLQSICPLKMSIDATAEEFNAARENGKGFSFSPKSPQNYEWLIRGQTVQDEQDL